MFLNEYCPRLVTTLSPGFRKDARRPSGLDGRTRARRGATHKWARPALRTAEEMALMAVIAALSSCVSSPVAPLACRPVSVTKRVSVHWCDVAFKPLDRNIRYIFLREITNACSLAQNRPVMQMSTFFSKRESTSLQSSTSLMFFPPSCIHNPLSVRLTQLAL